MRVPELADAIKAVLEKRSTPLDAFVANYSPPRGAGSAIFRERLQTVIDEAKDAKS